MSISNIAGEVIHELCSFTSSPNNKGQYFHTLFISGGKYYVLQKSINISHADFPQKEGKGSVLGWTTTSHGKAEFGTFTCNRLSRLFSNSNANREIVTSNVVNNSEKENPVSPGMFNIDTGKNITCKDSIFINNYFTSLVRSTGTGEVYFQNSTFYECSFTEETSFPSIESRPNTTKLYYICEWDVKAPTAEFTEMQLSFREMHLKFVLFLIWLS